MIVSTLLYILYILTDWFHWRGPGVRRKAVFSAVFRLPSFSFKPKGRRTSFQASSDIAPKVIGSCSRWIEFGELVCRAKCFILRRMCLFEAKCQTSKARKAIRSRGIAALWRILQPRWQVQRPKGMFMHVSTCLGCLPIFHRSPNTHRTPRVGRLGTGRFMGSQASRTASRTFEKPEQPADGYCSSVFGADFETHPTVESVNITLNTKRSEVVPILPLGHLPRFASEPKACATTSCSPTPWLLTKKSGHLH
jgi:hypothetical protein